MPPRGMEAPDSRGPSAPPDRDVQTHLATATGKMNGAAGTARGDSSAAGSWWQVRGNLASGAARPARARQDWWRRKTAGFESNRDRAGTPGKCPCSGASPGRNRRELQQGKVVATRACIRGLTSVRRLTARKFQVSSRKGFSPPPSHLQAPFSPIAGRSERSVLPGRSAATSRAGCPCTRRGPRRCRPRAASRRARAGCL